MNVGAESEIVEAKSDPTATVMAKSAADILEKLRSPTIRGVSPIIV